MNIDLALERMPHSGPMLLIADILDASDTTISCQATDHRDADYPLRLDGQLHALTLIEIGAQAAAAHASLSSMQHKHIGLLVSLQKVKALRDRVDPTTERLVAKAEQLQASESGAAYRINVSDRLGALVEGKALLRMERIDS